MDEFYLGLQGKIERQEKRIAELREMVADFQDRYHGCLDENKKLRGLLVDVYSLLDDDGHGIENDYDLAVCDKCQWMNQTEIQELLKDDTQMPS